MSKPRAKDITKTCVTCDSKFVTRDTKRGRKKETCSGTCARKLISIRSRINVTCSICGNSMETSKGHKNDAVFRCDSCKNKRFEKECAVCNKVFWADRKGQKTCSRECGNILGGSHIKEYICYHCGEVFKRSTRDVYTGKRIFCSKTCSLNQYSLDNPSRYGGTWNRRMREIKNRDNHKCTRCGKSNKEDSNVILECHHIIPVTSFENLNDAHYDDNVVTLCKECHLIEERAN